MEKVRDTITNAYLTDPRYRILYLVPHPDQDLRDASPFQGATDGLIDTANLLEQVMTFPADVREICTEWTHIATFRSTGLIAHRIAPIESSAFSEMIRIAAFPWFRCVISNEKSADFVDEQIKHDPEAWLHISTLSGAGRLELEKVTRNDFLQYVKRRLYQLTAPEAKSFVDTIGVLLNDKLPSWRRINLHASRHNLTRFNEMALLSFGCRPHENGPMSPGKEIAAIRWILRSFDFVERRRQELVSPRAIANAILLSAPAVFRHTYDRKFIARLARRTTAPRIARSAMNALLKPKTYLWHTDSDVVDQIISRPEIGFAMEIRKRELAVYSSLLTRLSAEALVPTIRLNPGVNLIRGTLKHLGECSRRPGPRKHEKRAKLFQRVQQVFEGEIDREYVSRVNALGSVSRGIKLASDLPLEWVPINGVPLMLRHDCSRVPLTPASLSYMVATNLDPVFITPSQLRDVLVIRSFSESDNIRDILEDALKGNEVWKSAASPATVKFKDVETEDQLVDAINEHKGAIIVFDCHGRLDSDGHIASLIIGGEPVWLWQLRKRIRRMPPIVLLSACDTLPVDGSHASAAISMLLLGAKAVLGTLLPIDAVRAANFIGRLVYRIGEFVPLALQHQPLVTWREIASGMIKMSHLTEVLHRLVIRGYLNREQYEQLHMAGNMDINQKRADWFERLSQNFAKISDLSVQRAFDELCHTAGLTDALLYVQLGHPELVFLGQHDLADLARYQRKSEEKSL